MPSVKVCLWNIQNYGAGKASERKWGKDSALRNRFIRDFVRREALDVLLIMEVSVTAQASLRDLGTKLNEGLLGGEADWAVSFCGSAITKYAPNPPVKPGEVTFKTDARSEGYAVLWRTNQLGRFRMLDALNQIAMHTYQQGAAAAPQSPLNVSTLGRPAGMVPVMVGGGVKRKPVEEWQVQGGYLQANAFPYKGKAVMAHWPNLELPATSTVNPDQLALRRVRRPVYVVLNINRAGHPTNQDRLCPVSAYHAPSRQQGAQWGVEQSALSRDIYVTNSLLPNGKPDPANLVPVNHAVFGGDFNYSEGNWPGLYKTFVDPLSKDPTGGTQSDVAPPGAAADAKRRSTVTLLEKDHKTPIKSAELEDYLRYKIDLVFFAHGDKGALVNIPEKMLADVKVNPYSATLQAFRAHLDALAKSVKGPKQQITANGAGPEEQRRTRGKVKKLVWAPMICGAWGASFENWKTFMKELNDGKLAHARQAAEFFHIFVSDHLPVVVEMEI